MKGSFIIGNSWKWHRDDLRLLKQFDFDKDYLYGLENKKIKIARQIQSILDEIANLEAGQTNVAENQRQLTGRNSGIDWLLKKEAERKIKAQEFVQANGEYIQNKHHEQEISASITRITKEKEKINGDLTKLNKEKDSLIEQRTEVKKYC